MLTVMPLKLTQLLEDHHNFESSWVIQFIVNFNKNFNSLFTA